MSITLISSPPSPFARINRIALLEKGIPFELKMEIPWHENETETPKYNPLEKLPILLFDDGREPVYDSAHIQEYIVQKYADRGPRLLTGDLDTDLKARQIQNLSEGIMDAFVLYYFETERGEHKSEAWAARQYRKIDGGLRGLNDLVKKRSAAGTEFLLGQEMTIADIAAVCATAQIEFQGLRKNWKEAYPDLAKYWATMEEREHFKATAPKGFDLRGGVV